MQACAKPGLPRKRAAPLISRFTVGAVYDRRLEFGHFSELLVKQTRIYVSDVSRFANP